MFYEPGKRNHGLPHDPLKAIVAPRPIGWISTLSEHGIVNLAPYSFFNLLSERPPVVIFSSAGRKHSLENAARTGAFVCNIATLPLLEALNRTSAAVPAEVDEMQMAGLAPAPSRLVSPPRVAASPCALECLFIESREVKGRDGTSSGYIMALGEVIGVHLDETFIENGLVNTAKMQNLARGGYFDYSTVERTISLPRPEV